MSVRTGVLGVSIGFLLAGCSGTSRETPVPASAPAKVARYSVADLYKNAEFLGASFSADGAKILASSNRSGIWNAFAIPTTGGDPTALTSSTTDSIFAASYFPNDGRFLYTSDRGGNELSHVFVRNEDGTIRDLTPGEKLNANFAGWASDDKSFFVTSNERDQRYFDLYEYSTDSYSRTPFYKNVRGFDLGPVSR